MDKMVVFDFDKTLTYKDSVWGFFDFCSANVRLKRFKKASYFFRVLLAKVGIGSLDDAKSYGIRVFLGHLTKEKLEVYGQEYAVKFVFNKAYHEVFTKTNEPWIASASLSLYLSPLVDESRLVAAELNYNKEGCPDGTFESCTGEQKAVRFRQLGISTIDVFYTDSRSDLPLAKMAKKVFKIKGDQVVELQSINDL